LPHNFTTAAAVRPNPGRVPARWWRHCRCDSHEEKIMSSAELMHVGFAEPQQRRERRRKVAPAHLIAAVALVLSIAVDAAVVSIGISGAPPTASASQSAPDLSERDPRAPDLRAPDLRAPNLRAPNLR
jgi:hypothetical protein